MKKIALTALAAASLAAMTVPAAAQSYERHDRYGSYEQNRGSYEQNGRYERDRQDEQDRYDRRGDARWSGRPDMNKRLAQLDRYIDDGARRGSLTRAETHYLRGEFREVVRLEARYRSDGFSGWERADLTRRMDRLGARIQQARAGTLGREYGSNDYRR